MPPQVNICRSEDKLAEGRGVTGQTCCLFQWRPTRAFIPHRPGGSGARTPHLHPPPHTSVSWGKGREPGERPEGVRAGALGRFPHVGTDAPRLVSPLGNRPARPAVTGMASSALQQPPALPQHGELCGSGSGERLPPEQPRPQPPSLGLAVQHAVHARPARPEPPLRPFHEVSPPGRRPLPPQTRPSLYNLASPARNGPRQRVN